jgi:DMSO/TMAO reductase YedYZ molybdopterin-dependent catalytic subunit
MKNDNEIRPFTEKDLRRLNRRELLKLTPLLALGALASPGFSEKLIKHGLDCSDAAAEKLFRHAALAQTFSNREVTPLDKFPLNSYSDYEPSNDLANWTLTVGGLVERPGEYTLEQIKALPRQTQNVKHICIEGWDVIGNFGGVRLSDFLRSVGADPAARFVEVACLDFYYSSYDMASCRHPQTLLCYEMYGEPLKPQHGAPLRIQMPVKLGYKSAKYLMEIRVTNVLGKEKGFWEDQGYSWYGGI